MRYIIEYGLFDNIEGYWIELKMDNIIEQYFIFETKKEVANKIKYYKKMYQIEKIIENL